MYSFLKTRLNRIFARIRKRFGFSRPQLRGFMLDPYPKDKDVTDALLLGANLFRYQIFYQNMEHFNKVIIPQIDRILDICEKANAKIVLDLHKTPGDVIMLDNRPHSHLFHNRNLQQEFYSIWFTLATRYKNRKGIWAYDLINEPAYWGRQSKGSVSLKKMYLNTVGMIRAIDRKTNIILEPPFGDPTKLSRAKIRSNRRIWYSPHMYYPMNLTHQNTPGHRYTKERKYPSSEFNRKDLNNYLDQIKKFELDNNVRVYIGEFSCIRWAPGKTAPNYILDCIKYFEKNHWPWTYHAWREYQGWNPEFTPELLETFNTFFKENR